MKTINETFTDDEIKEMMISKTASDMSWHDLILDAIKKWKRQEDAGWVVD